ncbi:hypothetical protein SAMN02745146_1736 [Hymenobacter daecheongensis DSM 21074]|uniref:Uncharacterized protein n=1 Tax=Hymenobacter daecheongensis DSM 21074 TaxID=1121955 RepID=A0A1M6ELU3_9BACT|nr:hypothetical protein [Hymenobacter daecheongensis]SHI86424.1 hypothetical protein SAMN02745146_1736 [Hymenobacter daecheongensis DSM 21074]
MILFNLLTLSPAAARTVAHLVLTERLATDVFVDEAIENYCLTAAGTVSTEPLYRVLFLTKALLYRRIELLLQEQFPDNDFRIYATAVTQVNDAEAERVRRLQPA